MKGKRRVVAGLCHRAVHALEKHPPVPFGGLSVPTAAGRRRRREQTPP